MPNSDALVVCDFFEKMDGAIGEVSFVKKPDLRLLAEFSDLKGETILLSFGEAYLLGAVSEIAEEVWSHQIKSAFLEADAFCEMADEWFEFTHIQSLTIIAKLGDQNSFFEEEGLISFRNGVSEGMRDLRSLRVILNCSYEALVHAQELLTWPLASFEWRVEAGKKFTRRKMNNAS